MKIIIIGSAHPLRGGLASFNERLAAALQEQGNEVVIYSFSLQYPSFLFPGKTQYTDEAAPEHLKIVTAINSINPFNWIRVGRQIKKERPDLIIIKYWLPFMGPCFGTLLRTAKTKSTRVVSILDNVIPHEHRPGDRAFTRYFLKPVDAFVAMSREVLRDLRLFTNKPAAFCPHPIYDNYGEQVDRDVALKKLGLTDDKIYLLFFGFIRKYKGLDMLLEAMQDKRIVEKDLHLIVAGEFYEDEDNYRHLLEAVKDRVHLYSDFIPNEEVKYFFSAADLVVQPYRSATQSGITQIAYHFECPMVVTDIGGLPEVVPDGKVGFVAAPQPAAIADAITQFFDHPIPDLKKSIQNEKKKYGWDTFVAHLLRTTFSEKDKQGEKQRIKKSRV